jgi:amino acid adenylation domain-containing protein
VSEVQSLIEAWVRRRPDACAICDPVARRQLTFHELWQQSGRVRRELLARGIGRGHLVAVDLPRSVDLVVCVLGIVRAGAAYLPLDAHAPDERIAGILREAGVRLIVGDRDATPARRLPAEVEHVAAAALVSSAVTRGADPATVAVAPDDPIYVTYTSGSTGRPKGVVVPHRAVTRLVTAPNYCTIAPGDRVANASNPAFDATTFELWSTLTAGATVVVLPGVGDLAIDAWIGLVRSERITTMFLTTSLFHMVARERPAGFGTLGTLIVGGEQLDAAAVRRVLDAEPPRRLVNGYGPTETTTFATAYECTAGSLAGCRRTPIGYALQETRLHVLDGDLSPVAAGEPGELCIGGPGVALGYLHRPELTAERFVAEPGADGQARGTMYRTGDVVRELPSGALELLGRRDRQVKLRGFRIELEEIEAAAIETGLADVAFVEKVGDGPSARLVGFALAARGARATNGELPEALAVSLRRRLPSYMLPSRWIVLAELPLGPTGKLDRASLTAQLQTLPHDDEVAAEPAVHDLAYIGLLTILQDLLGLPEIRPDDNFIELGGNSILAVQTASRVRQQLTVELESGDVLLAESVGELAERVRSLQAVLP